MISSREREADPIAEALSLQDLQPHQFLKHPRGIDPGRRNAQAGHGDNARYCYAAPEGAW